ncbi:hypothetical protein [Streptomyces sp. WAC 06725]|uniref:hypothetical protein n=1 Tax=Streptomyces sp. WAC 06725 TaxID=2203209 RepID=UPI000F7374AD|nr:hypothetical protein [Streptomyces sp. WAC 06725]
MTKRRADYPCVLPGDPAWIDDARYVQETLDCLAAAAAVAHDYGEPEKYVLAHLPFQVAADTLGRIRFDMPPARRDAVFLMALPAFELEALWEVLGVLRRARDADDAAAEVYDLVRDYAMRCFTPPCDVDDVVADLERVLAVLVSQARADNVCRRVRTALWCSTSQKC